MKKDRVAEIINKRMLTTGVGILQLLEDNFGDLWGETKEETELTDEEKRLDQLYNKVRSQILDHTHIQRSKLIKEVKDHYGDK
jgi:hypothetical protein